MGIENIQFYYDQMDNEGYDEIYGGPICKAEDQVLMSVVQGGIENSKLLDIGCGTGLIASYLKDNKISYTGIDLSWNELKTANKKLSSFGARFIQGDMHELPFAKKTFSSLVSAYGPFSYSPTPRVLLSEFFRVLKPYGFLAVMPYTKRTGLSVGLGGFSTAVEPSIKKIFYTDTLATKVFDLVNDRKIVGINYLVNFIAEDVKNGKLVQSLTSEYLAEKLHKLGRMVDPEHFLPKDVKFGNLCELFNSYLKDTESVGLLTKILIEEMRVFDKIVPSHWARHMLVLGKK